MANQVTLTFAGETKGLEESFHKAGGAARQMGDETHDGFHKAGEAADAVDTKAMGFRDTVTGVQDSMTGLHMLMGDRKPGQTMADSLLTLGMGVGDLGSGFYNFLIPALKGTKVATLAQAAAGKVAGGASKVWAAGQWLLNASLLASPITWIIVGIVALVAVIVLIATKTNWFQRAWGAAWGFIRSAASNAWGFIRQIPGWIAGAFSGIAGSISSPFRSAFNFIASAWNNTVGGLSFSIPSWVPGLGGNSFGVPRIPYFHSGGVVPGVVGTNVLAMVQAGERVGSVASGGSGGQTIVINVGGQRLGDVLLDPLRQAVRTRGGDVQAVLGR
jgi:hypothetical protein